MSYEMDSLETTRHRAALVVQKICHKYGLYGNVVYYAPSPIPDSDRNRLYIVAGLDPAIEQDSKVSSLRPDDTERRMKRNHKLFYPKAWVFDLFENKNDIQAQQDLVEYCKTADFLAQLFNEYNTPLPERLRTSEINQLIEYRSLLDNPATPEPLRNKCSKALDWFFKRENSKRAFRRKWLSYYRSEHFPDEKGAMGRILAYFRRQSNKIDVKQLMDVNSKLHKLEMQEHEYKIFVKLMKETHPEVIFSVGEKTVVDHGLITASSSSSPLGRAVTGEEYAVIRKDRFAKEGFAALADLRPAYWEFRDIHFRAVDEPLVAGVYNRITLSYARCNSLMEMKERGDLKLEKIPVTDFMNFVSLAKANGFRFYIDNDGDYANPSLEFINVIYNGCQESKWLGIKERLIGDKIEYSHLLTSEHPSLSCTLRSIEKARRSSSHGRAPQNFSR